MATGKTLLAAAFVTFCFETVFGYDYVPNPICPSRDDGAYTTSSKFAYVQAPTKIGDELLVMTTRNQAVIFSKKRVKLISSYEASDINLEAVLRINEEIVYLGFGKERLLMLDSKLDVIREFGSANYKYPSAKIIDDRVNVLIISGGGKRISATMYSVDVAKVYSNDFDSYEYVVNNRLGYGEVAAASMTSNYTIRASSKWEMYTTHSDDEKPHIIIGPAAIQGVGDFNMASGLHGDLYVSHDLSSWAKISTDIENSGFSDIGCSKSACIAVDYCGNIVKTANNHDVAAIYKNMDYAYENLVLMKDGAYIFGYKKEGRYWVPLVLFLDLHSSQIEDLTKEYIEALSGA